MGPKTLPTIWGIYMTLVTKYQISVIKSCWEKCDEKCAYMFNVYKDQLSQQTGSRNLTGPKTLPTIWYTYMMLVTKYQISAINSYWEKCDEKYPGRTEGPDGQTDRGKTGSGGIITRNINSFKMMILLSSICYVTMEIIPKQKLWMHSVRILCTAGDYDLLRFMCFCTYLSKIFQLLWNISAEKTFSWLLNSVWLIWFDFGVLTPLSVIFQLYHGDSF